MANNLMVTEPAVMQVMAKNIAESGFFGFKNPSQAYAMLMIAESKGLHPVALLQDYHIINNKPALKSAAVLSRFQKAGGKIEYIKSDDNECIAKFSHELGGELTIKWDIDKAKNAGIYNSNPVWKKYPSNLLRARCITDGVIAILPSCLDGGVPETQIQDTIEDIESEPIKDKEIETVEIVEDINVLKKELSIKLKKYQFNNADISAFASKYNLSDDIDGIKELLDSKELLEQKINEYEKGNI